MGALEKKDTQNQENVARFISIAENYSSLTERVIASLDNHVAKIEWHTEKLWVIHDDVKEIKKYCKTCPIWKD